VRVSFFRGSSKILFFNLFNSTPASLIKNWRLLHDSPSLLLFHNSLLFFHNCGGAYSYAVKVDPKS
jgi:hypothetical protein